MVRTKDGSALGDDVYLPLDTTPKSGASANATEVLTSWGLPGEDVSAGSETEATDAVDGERTFVDALVAELPSMTFDRGADFIVALHRAGDSRVVVQERYECLRAMMLWRLALDDAYANPPAQDSETFRTIELGLRTVRDSAGDNRDGQVTIGADDERTFETGLLREGVANPSSEEYDSLADYCFGEDFVEVRLPWQLLNFSNPSEMQVHDDYYEHYGVENLAIKGIGVGATQAQSKYHATTNVAMAEVPLEGWGTKPTYHERLKLSYYALQEVWTSVDPAAAAKCKVEDAVS